MRYTKLRDYLYLKEYRLDNGYRFVFMSYYKTNYFRLYTHPKGFRFYPTKITTFFFEDTFIFKTEEEAQGAFKQFGDKFVGWWYSEDKFLEDQAKRDKEQPKALNKYN